MVLAEVDFDADILHAVSGNHAALQPVAEPLLHGGHEVARDRAAHDRVDPEEVVRLVVVNFLHRGEAFLGCVLLDVRAGRQREHADVDLGELAASAALLLVAVAACGVCLDRFAVGDLWRLGVDLDLVAALEPLLDDL